MRTILLLSALSLAATAGTLAAAGPVESDPALAAIVIFKTASVEDARRAMGLGPSVGPGELVPEFDAWRCTHLVLPW